MGAGDGGEEDGRGGGGCKAGAGPGACIGLGIRIRGGAVEGPDAGPEAGPSTAGSGSVVNTLSMKIAAMPSLTGHLFTAVTGAVNPFFWTLTALFGVESFANTPNGEDLLLDNSSTVPPWTVFMRGEEELP